MHTGCFLYMLVCVWDKLQAWICWAIEFYTFVVLTEVCENVLHKKIATYFALIMFQAASFPWALSKCWIFAHLLGSRVSVTLCIYYVMNELEGLFICFTYLCLHFREVPDRIVGCFWGVFFNWLFRLWLWELFILGDQPFVIQVANISHFVISLIAFFFFLTT